MLPSYIMGVQGNPPGLKDSPRESEEEMKVAARPLPFIPGSHNDQQGVNDSKISAAVNYDNGGKILRNLSAVEDDENESDNKDDTQSILVQSDDDVSKPAGYVAAASTSTRKRIWEASKTDQNITGQASKTSKVSFASPKKQHVGHSRCFK